jgi:hypothetical protein
MPKWLKWLTLEVLTTLLKNACRSSIAAYFTKVKMSNAMQHDLSLEVLTTHLKNVLQEYIA